MSGWVDFVLGMGAQGRSHIVEKCVLFIGIAGALFSCSSLRFIYEGITCIYVGSWDIVANCVTTDCLS